MSIKFKVIPRKNPRDLTAEPKYYAIAIRGGLVDIDRLGTFSIGLSSEGIK